MEKSNVDILRDEPHIVRIEEPEEWSFHPISLKLWKRDNRKNVEEVIQLLQEYLGMYYIVDDFENHSERRRWRASMKQKYDWFYDLYQGKNALGGNFVSVMQLHIAHFRTDYRGDVEGLKQLINNVAKFKDRGYDELPTEEKVKFVKDYKRQIYAVLDFLSKDSPPYPKGVLQSIRGLGRFVNWKKLFYKHT